jgi:hypothetical protein
MSILNFEKPKESYKIITLADWGPQLPVGYEVGGKLVKDFAPGPWKTRQEKLLGEAKKEQKGKSLGAFVTKMLGILMTQIGPHQNFNQLDEAEKDLIISQSYMADILYMYIWLRHRFLGDKISMDAVCPNCDNEFVWNGDLSTLDISVVQDSNQLKREVVLKDGMLLHGDLRKSLIVRPPFWGAMEHPKLLETSNEVEQDIILIKDSIIGAEGLNGDQPLAVTDEAIDDLEKWDYETLVAEINEAPGPNMLAKISCRCSYRWMQMIRWRYDSFFKLSSQSPAGRG